MTNEFNDQEAFADSQKVFDEYYEAPAIEVELTKLSRFTHFCGRNALRGGLIGLFGIGALNTFGQSDAQIGPATIESSIQPDAGGDVVVNASIGEMSFDFSDGPLGMNLRIQSINNDAPSEIESVIEGVDQGVIKNSLDQYEDETQELINETILKGLLAMGLGGVFGAGVAEASLMIAKSHKNQTPITNETLKRARKAIIIGPIVMMSLVGATTAITYNGDALKHPTFNKDDSLGTIVNLSNSTLNSFDKYKQNTVNLNTWLDDLLAWQKNVETENMPSQNLVPVLMISDIHSRPCTYESVQQVVEAFDAKFVLNAGDETEWGLPFENSFFNSECLDDSIANVRVPIFFVKGNHDSNETVDALKQYENVTVLEGQEESITVELNNDKITFDILGDSDPLYTSDFTDRESIAIEQKQEQDLGIDLGEKALIQDPDIIIVHQPLAADEITRMLDSGQSTVINGHMHKYGLEKVGETVQVAIPSTGASGLRGYKEGFTNEIGMLIGYFDPNTKELVSVLDLSINNDGSFEGNMDYLNGDHPTVSSNTPEPNKTTTP